MIWEKFDSRDSTVSPAGSDIELKYTVVGSEDDAAVRAQVEATIPAFYATMPFQNYRIAHQGGGLWEVSVRYGARQGSSYTFETSGGTQHVSQSKQTVASYGIEDPPDFKGAIGVNNDSVAGVDITIPVYNFSETHHFPKTVITPAYKLILFALTGNVNGFLFKGFAPGEVLFLGATGSQRGEEDWEINYKFAASPNATGLQIGDITGIDKRGWEYLWIRYQDAEDANVLVKQPYAVYVERLYDDGDFSLLGIGV